MNAPVGGDGAPRDAHETVLAPLPKALRLLRGFLRPVRGSLLWMVVIESIIVVSIFIRPWFLGTAIDRGLADSGLSAGYIAWLSLGLLGTWVVRFVGAGCAHYLGGRAAIRVLNDLRRAVFAHVQHLSVAYFDRNRAGTIISRADRDVDALEGAVITGPSELAGMALRCLGAGVVLFLLSPRLFWWLLGIVPILGLAMYIFHRLGETLWARLMSLRSQMVAHLVETVNGVRVIQQTVREQANRAHYAALRHEVDRAAVRASVGWGWFPGFSMVLTTLGLGALLVIGGIEAQAGRMSYGDLARCIWYIFLFLGPVQELGDLFEKFASAGVAARRIGGLLLTPATVVDPPHPQELTAVQGRVQFIGVRFAYTGSPPWILDGIDLDIPAGQTVAIVGPTGHGKSTLVQLLCRFYDPQEGVIAVDGVDVRQVRFADLRRQVSVVLQDNVLFTGSVLDNLRLAAPTHSDEELIASCKELGADEVLERLIQGYHTQVGPQGQYLSVGQRQLVCLVRAHVAQPRILVLDEATSAIDLHTEARIRRALKRLSTGRTAIIVAHRLSTIRDADRIIVIRHGRVVEQGTHDELTALGGAYADLYRAYEEHGAPE